VREEVPEGACLLMDQVGRSSWAALGVALAPGRPWARGGGWPALAVLNSISFSPLMRLSCGSSSYRPIMSSRLTAWGEGEAREG
jgi:hypothetical protein